MGVINKAEMPKKENGKIIIRDLKIGRRPLSEIKPYPQNAKLHPEKQVELLAKSIQRFGMAQPISVDTAGVIITGHGRYYAAKKLGLTEVIVSEVDWLTEDEIRAYRLADNKIGDTAFDKTLVGEELFTLSEDLRELTGFTQKDVKAENPPEDDAVPEDPIEPLVKRGDIFQLGAHRLLCGDSTNPDDVAKLMDGKKADVVFTDPPYNVNYAGRGKNTSNTIKNDNMGAEQFDDFLDATFANFRKYTKKSAGVYVFHSTSTQVAFENAIRKNGFYIKNQLIWNKPVASMGWGDYRWKHEPFFYCGTEGTEAVFYAGRDQTTVVDFQATEEQLVKWAKAVKEAESKGLTTVWTVKRDNVNEYKHPTQKPIQLVTHALLNSSRGDDIVLDLFLGSGSTLIGAEKLGRRCYGMELDEKYAHVILDRWAEYAKGDPIRLSDGAKWSEIKNKAN